MASATNTLAPARFIQVDQALITIQDEINEALRNGEEIPESSLARAAAYIEESRENVDTLARWFDEQHDRVAYAKKVEKNIAAQREAIELTLAATSAYLRASIDGKAQLALEDGEKPPKGPNTIEGILRKFWIQNASSPKLVIAEDADIPEEFHSRPITITIPAGEVGDVQLAEIERILEDFELEYKTGETKRDDKALRQALEGGEVYQGAELVTTRTLRRNKPKAVPFNEIEEESAA